MCLLMVKPADVDLPDSDIRDIYNANGDGFGVVYRDPIVGLRVHKALPKDEDQAVKAYRDLDLREKECILHWRLATHGSETLDNCHPFEVRAPGGAKLFLAHNGVLDCRRLGLQTGDGTDTVAYVRHYLEPVLAQLPVGGAIDALSGPLGAMVGDHIGNSKFALMDNTGRIAVINFDRGTHIERDGKKIWVSNTHWVPWVSPGLSVKGGLGHYDSDYSGYIKPFKSKSKSKSKALPPPSTEDDWRAWHDAAREVAETLEYWATEEQQRTFFDIDPDAAWDALDAVHDGEIDLYDLIEQVLEAGQSA